MLIISVRDKENNRWKRKAGKKKQQRKRRTTAILKGWQLIDFIVHLS